MKVLLSTLVLLLATTVAMAIDSFGIKFYGLSAKLSFPQMRAQLLRQGFAEKEQVGETATVNHLFKKAGGEQVLVVTSNGKFLAALPAKIIYRATQISIGDESKVLSALGNPDEKRRADDGYEFVYNDQKEQVPVVVTVSRQHRISKIELSPGRTTNE